MKLSDDEYKHDEGVFPLFSDDFLEYYWSVVDSAVQKEAGMPHTASNETYSGPSRAVVLSARHP